MGSAGEAMDHHMHCQPIDRSGSHCHLQVVTDTDPVLSPLRRFNTDPDIPHSRHKDNLSSLLPKIEAIINGDLWCNMLLRLSELFEGRIY